MIGNSPPGADSVDTNHLTKGLVRLTMACNEQCQFCNLPVEDTGTRAMDAGEIGEALRAFKASGERTLTISGGEPTLLRKPLVNLVTAARQLGIPFVELQTTGALVDAHYAAELQDAGLTSAFVGLLSHEASIHDDLMNRVGAHAACLSGIDALLDADIRVTLNPVITRSMESLVDDYVGYVAQRLPRVTSISLSVVQPHGRAGDDLDLLPDYGVLAESIRAAQRRAEATSIELLNPYCGLPICIGWEQATNRCVEAVEALAARRSGQLSVVGLDNRGDKRHGEPCRRCALRPLCGGAWHAYWDHREGRGLHPPDPRLEPWDEGARAASGQRIIEAHDDLCAETLERLAATSAPTVWLAVRRLRRGDGLRLASAGCTDLALTTSPQLLTEHTDTVRELRQIVRRNESLPPQLRCLVTVGLEPIGPAEERDQAIQLAKALGVQAVRLLAQDRRESRVVVTARARHPTRLDDGAVDHPPPDPSIPELTDLSQQVPPGSRIWISGGEPTLRSDLPRLIAALSHQGHGDLGLCTDGLALADPTAVAPLIDRGLRRVRLILHSPRPEAHDWLVKQPGAARRVLRAIRTCVAAGLTVELQATMTRPTMSHLTELVELGSHLGIGALHLRRLVARGPAADHFVMLAPRLALLQRDLRDAMAKADHKSLPLFLRGLPPCTVPSADEGPVPSVEVRWLRLETSDWSPLIDQLADPIAPAISPPLDSCRSCPWSTRCDGAPADYVTQFGASELSPSGRQLPSDGGSKHRGASSSDIL